MSLYYLIASLPPLQFGTKPPLTLAEFLAECQKSLSPKDFQAVTQSLSSDNGPAFYPFLRRWEEFKKSLNHESVWVRAADLKIDPMEFLDGPHQEAQADIVEALADAFKASDPLSAERILDTLIWQKIEEIESLHYFDMEQLVAYGLKLKILERYVRIASPLGRTKFEELKADLAHRY